jgi:hypothetical protein
VLSGRNVRWPISFLEMAGWTKAIVRLEGRNRVVTKGYQKGVYEWGYLGNRGGGEARAYRGLKPWLILTAFRGAEAPLFHGAGLALLFHGFGLLPIPI